MAIYGYESEDEHEHGEMLCKQELLCEDQDFFFASQDSRPLHAKTPLVVLATK